LFYIFESDDVYREQAGNVVWFSLLRDLNWQLLRPVAAKYYDALYRFNVQQARDRQRNLPRNPESKEEATEPERVYAKLIENPAYARSCGFTLPKKDGSYRQSDIPSLRKLEQFDQIMSQTGLWGEARVLQVRDNLASGKIKIESTVVHDTTHYHAYSQMRVVEADLPQEPQDDARTVDYGDDQLTKRGNDPFQARLDKTLLAMHLVIAQE